QFLFNPMQKINLLMLLVNSIKSSESIVEREQSLEYNKRSFDIKDQISLELESKNDSVPDRTIIKFTDKIYTQDEILSKLKERSQDKESCVRVLEIYLDNLNLKEIFKEIKEFKNTRILSLSGNKIDSFETSSEIFENLSNL